MTASTIPPLSVWPCGTSCGNTQEGTDRLRSAPITDPLSLGFLFRDALSGHSLHSSCFPCPLCAGYPSKNHKVARARARASASWSWPCGAARRKRTLTRGGLAGGLVGTTSVCKKCASYSARTALAWSQSTSGLRCTARRGWWRRGSCTKFALVCGEPLGASASTIAGLPSVP